MSTVFPKLDHGLFHSGINMAQSIEHTLIKEPKEHSFQESTAQTALVNNHVKGDTRGVGDTP